MRPSCHTSTLPRLDPWVRTQVTEGYQERNAGTFQVEKELGGNLFMQLCKASNVRFCLDSRVLVLEKLNRMMHHAAAIHVNRPCLSDGVQSIVKISTVELGNHFPKAALDLPRVSP